MTSLSAIAGDVSGRPTGYSAGENERRWKAAVRSAFAGKAVPPSSRVAIEVEYRLELSQIGHNAPDLDRLPKATIKALNELLGHRPGRFDRPQAHAERIDRKVASKRLAPLRPDTRCPMLIVEL